MSGFDPNRLNNQYVAIVSSHKSQPIGKSPQKKLLTQHRLADRNWRNTDHMPPGYGALVIVQLK